MPVLPRRAVINELVVGSYHISSRAVRRGFLLGSDTETEREFPHRKNLVLRRLESLVSIFAVECLDVAVLDSSFDLILRNRPDVAARWTDREVAERWLQLHRSRLELKARPSLAEVTDLVEDVERLGKIRRRLSSISWFMAYLKEPLAKRFNFEDAVDGHFWAERFGCVKLGSEVELLACSSYVALNPWRAGEAVSWDSTEHTSATMRDADRKSGDVQRSRSGWLAALPIAGDGYAGAEARRRLTDEGFLRLTLAEHREVVSSLAALELAEREGRRVDDRWPAVLQRLGISLADWEAALRVTRRRFARELDRAARRRAEARRRRTTGQ